jgi:hypothetical protein
MSNDPNVPKDLIQTELQSEVAAAFPRTAMAAMLMAAAIAMLAFTTFVHRDQPAAANAVLASAPAPSMASVPVQRPQLGFLEYEEAMWQAAAPVWSPSRAMHGAE